MDDVMTKEKLENYKREYIYLRKKLFDDLNTYLIDKRVEGVARKLNRSVSWFAKVKLHNQEIGMKKLFEVYEQIING